MSDATTLDKTDVQKVTGPATRPVTMVIQYGKDARMTHVTLRITAADAVGMVNLRKSSICSRVEYSGVDCNGNPYLVEIGSQAVALYVEV